MSRGRGRGGGWRVGGLRCDLGLRRRLRRRAGRSEGGGGIAVGEVLAADGGEFVLGGGAGVGRWRGEAVAEVFGEVEGAAAGDADGVGGGVRVVGLETSGLLFGGAEVELGVGAAFAV